MKIEINLPCFTKIVAVICGVLIIVLAVSRFATLDISHFQQFILTIHYIWLGAVLVLCEFNIVYVIDQFQVLSTYCGRGIYCLFLGTIMIKPSDTLQLIIAICLFLIAILYFIVQCLAKKYGWIIGGQKKNPYQIPTLNLPGADKQSEASPQKGPSYNPPPQNYTPKAGPALK